MNSFISQRESRLSLAIAAQQRRLAHATGKDSTSMKTLTLMGAMFLPGAFLSSVFSMSFFNFGNGAFIITLKFLTLLADIQETD